MGKQFLPFLTDDQGRSLSVENQVVITSSIPDPLNNSPEGWESNTLQWARNNEFRGIIQTYTTSLKFYLDGAKILRNAFYRIGMEVILYFIWLKQDVTFGSGMKYKGWYKGEPDFGTFKDEFDGVEISVKEGGFLKDLQANKSITYEIPFDLDTQFCYMDGMYLYQQLNYQDINALDISMNLYSQFFLGPYPLTGQDGSSVGFFIADNEDLQQSPNTYADTIASTNIILQNLLSVPVDITISGLIAFKCTSMTSSPAYAIKFRYLTSFLDITHQNDYLIISTPAMVVGQIYSQQFSITIILQPNETLLREGVFFGGVGTDAVINFESGSYSQIKFKTRSPANVVQMHSAFNYGNKMVAAMSSGHSLSSPLLEPDDNLKITTGDALRNTQGAVIKGTFTSYNKSIDAVKCIAIDIDVNTNNPVLTSRYDKFDKSSQIADLGPCSNWTLEPAGDYVYDTVQSGYPSKSSQGNNDVNGKYSFNNTYQWKINTTRKISNKYDCSSDYYADPYDIELIRVNFNQKDTTTANTDNSIFFLDCEKKTDISFSGDLVFDPIANTLQLIGDVSGIGIFLIYGMKITVTDLIFVASYQIAAPATIASDNSSATFKVVQLVASGGTVTGVTVTFTNLYKLRRLSYATINGIPNDGTVFNIELSPARCMRNHWRWLRSSFDHLDMNYLLFQSTDKNANLQTIDGSGNTITENANILVSTMGEKVFLPYMVKFNVRSPQNLKELMDANDNGKFDYSREGLPFDGFPVQIATDDAILSNQEYQLLCTANNDLTELINNR